MGSGGVTVAIERFLGEAAAFRADITPESLIGQSEGVARFTDGVLTLDRGYLRMQFMLGEGDRLDVSYEYPRMSDRGRWWLKKIQ
jgi:hypothetical protein